MSSTNRRTFLKKLGMGSVTGGLMPTALLAIDENTGPRDRDEQEKQFASGHEYNGSYSGDHLNRIAFPIGGIGAGMFCLEGTGAISHMSVRNKPDVFNEPGMFAAISVKGLENGAKVLEGAVPGWKKFGLRDAGNGLGGSTAGLPRFHHAEFKARFPFAVIDLNDPELSLHVQVTGWSPFIPADDDNSSLPVAGLEYKIVNTSNNTMDLVFSFNSKNFLRIEKGKNSISKIADGFILSETGTQENPSAKTDFGIFTDDNSAIIDYCWFRGGWWDPLTMTWNVISKTETRATDPVESNAPGASIFVPFKLAAGKYKLIKLMMAWYTPDSDLTAGASGPQKENCDPANGCCTSPGALGLDKYDKNFDGPFYKPWYSSRFRDIKEVADYWLQHYQELRDKSTLFKNAFYASTLPAEVTEVVAANLTILKSPTVLRQYDGRIWNWEGCADDWGCCHGSCTHVWNYAQALSHLFPALERSLRHTEFCEDQNAGGHQNFRARLPIKPADHGFHAAADGQLGGIMKVYREWRISGDNDWLRKMYPMVKASLDYCIRTWDPGNKGVIEEPHHNTYDIEF
ncbi:MAG TPA: GH116 family glycosyl-hydrolase, partial [Chitinophagaceae bacterium]|nr:GH116 family glycosyl-hydrolase [Chitinophagaceae bacterium]